MRHADKIIVMDNGSVIEEGNHETLMERRGHYYALVKAQVFEEPLESDEQQIPEITSYIGEIRLYFVSVTDICVFLVQKNPIPMIPSLTKK